MNESNLTIVLFDNLKGLQDNIKIMDQKRVHVTIISVRGKKAIYVDGKLEKAGTDVSLSDIDIGEDKVVASKTRERYMPSIDKMYSFPPSLQEFRQRFGHWTKL